MPRPISRARRTTLRFAVQRALFRLVSIVSPALAARLLARWFLATRRYSPPTREADWLRGATRAKFRSRGRDLDAWVWPAEGPSVLLAHGWEGRGAQLGAFVEPLRSEGFRVVTFDAPGHGSSPGRSSSLVEMADGILDASAALGPFEAVVAHSAGAAATTLALDRGLRARRLVYIAPPADLGEFLQYVASLLGTSQDITARARTFLEGRFGFSWEEIVHTRLATKMTHPLLLFHDAGDREIALEYSKRLQDSWRGSRLEVTEGLGHRRILRDERVVSRAISFLKAPPVGQPEAEPASASSPTEASTTRSLPSCLAR